MWARTRFDISWSDLAAGALHCALPGDRNAAQLGLERSWSPAGDALACFSVRSGFDLLLQALSLPAGSEILFSAINIKGMIKLAGRHDLVAVPVDLDLGYAAPRRDALERAVSEKSRVLVVAHLFGSRIDLSEVLAFARQHELFVIEDCAQAFDSPEDTGHPDCDASFFSFGPLKTATALGGGLARVRDAEVLARMRALQSEYPVHPRGNYFVRIAQFAVLKMLAYRLPYAVLLRFARLRGVEADAQITESVRGVAKQKSAKALRQRASGPMLALMQRRLRRWRPAKLEERVTRARTIVASSDELAVFPGARNERHAFWACTVLSKAPHELVAAMRAEGFDAAGSESLRVVPAPEGRREIEPVRAQQILDQLVFLPCYPGMPRREVEREAATLHRAFSSLETERSATPR